MLFRSSFFVRHTRVQDSDPKTNPTLFAQKLRQTRLPGPLCVLRQYRRTRDLADSDASAGPPSALRCPPRTPSPMSIPAHTTCPHPVDLLERLPHRRIGDPTVQSTVNLDLAHLLTKVLCDREPCQSSAGFGPRLRRSTVVRLSVWVPSTKRAARDTASEVGMSHRISRHRVSMGLESGSFVPGHARKHICRWVIAMAR